MRYGTFGQRFVALWIDILVMMPVVLVNAWLSSRSIAGATAMAFVSTAVGLAYVVYCHGRFGKTVGKHVMKIRVMRAEDGGHIGWREAWLRSSVDAGFALFAVTAHVAALSSVTGSDFLAANWMEQARLLAIHSPDWSFGVDLLGQVWFWSEVVVMLSNRRRRALHDFLAGTIVVDESPDELAEFGVA